MNVSEWIAREQRALGFFALGIVVVASACGNLLLRIGARSAAESMLFGLVAWQTIAGVASFGVGVIAYAWALKSIDIHVAQSVMAVQYVVIILLAAVLLGEKVPPQQWVGMGMIALGLLVCLRG